MSDRFLITNMMDIYHTGIYMVGMQVGMALGLLTDSFNKSFGPWLFRNLKNIDEYFKIRIVWYTYLYFVIVLALAIFLGLLAPWMLGFLVGEKFRQASGIVIYIAIGYAFHGMYLMVTNYIFYVSKTYFLAIITLCCGVLNISLSYILIKKFALNGAALSFMISQAAFFISTWLLAHKVYPMPWKKGFLK
jgi:O-antigen/teichoic acid export membrane protein